MNAFVTVAIVLAVLWFFGIFVINVSTPLLHIIIVIAAILFIYDVLTRGRRS